MPRSSLFTLLLVLFHVSVFAQYSFTTTYPLANRNYLAGAVEMPDHGFLLCGGTQKNTAGTNQNYVVRLDAKGDTLWTKKINVGKSTDGNFYDMTSSGDGNYLVVGAQAGVPFVIKINANGDTLWTRLYHYSFSAGFNRIVAGGNNRYYMQGGDYTDSFYLACINAVGDTLFTKTYNVNNNNILYSYCLLYANKQLYAGGFFPDSVSGTSPGSFIYGIDTLGKVSWKKYYTGFKNPQGIFYNQNTFIAGLQAFQGSSSIFAAYSSFITANGNNCLGLMKLNAHGDTLWNRQVINGEPKRQYDIPLGLCKSTIDNSLGIMGRYDALYGSTNDFAMAKLDTNGNVLWHNHYGDSTLQNPYGVIPCSDKGYLMAGFTSLDGTNSNRNIYVVKTDKAGHAPAAGIQIFTHIANTSDISISPNPFAQNATFTYNLPKSGTNIFLRVYDIRGGLIRSYPLSCQENALNISANDFENGVYLYGIESENYMAAKKKMVVVK